MHTYACIHRYIHIYININEFIPTDFPIHSGGLVMYRNWHTKYISTNAFYIRGRFNWFVSSAWRCLNPFRITTWCTNSCCEVKFDTVPHFWKDQFAGPCKTRQRFPTFFACIHVFVIWLEDEGFYVMRWRRRCVECETWDELSIPYKQMSTHSYACTHAYACAHPQSQAHIRKYTQTQMRTQT